MAELHEQDPLGRFSGFGRRLRALSAGLSPAEAIALPLFARRRWGPQSLLADGWLWHRHLVAIARRRRGYLLVGIEPNDAMRQRTEGDPPHDPAALCSHLSCRTGRGYRTGGSVGRWRCWRRRRFTGSSRRRPLAE